MQEAPRNLEELCQRYGQGWRPKFVFFWSHQPKRDAGLGNECFSQWFPVPFRIDGVEFPTAEHYMMWSKARLFDDPETASAVIAAKSPADAKRLGRGVRNFVETVWAEERYEIVLRASIAKFSQNENLLAYLLGTKTRVLVEASPADQIWGIGLDATDRRATNPLEWRGLNLLGFALMDARSRLV